MMDDEEETPEKARARKAAAEASPDQLPTKKRMKFQICPGSDEIDRPTPPEQITAIATSDRPPPSVRGGGRRKGPETPPVCELYHNKKKEPQRWMGVAAIERLRLPLQEITESNRPMQAAPRSQRRMEIAELERLKLQLEEKQKQSLGITGSNRPMQATPPIQRRIEIAGLERLNLRVEERKKNLEITGSNRPTPPKQITAIATSDRPPPSDRGGGRREGPETPPPPVCESSKKKKKVPQRGMGIAALELLRLQMEEERKKNLQLPFQEITASNRLVQASPRSLELSSSQNERRIVPVDRSDRPMQAALRWQSLMEITDLESLRLQEERKKNIRIDDVELPLQEITTSNRQNQNERRIVPVDRSEVRLQTRPWPRVTASNSPAPQLSLSRNERRLVPVDRSEFHVQDSPINVSTSKPSPPGDDPTVGSTGDAPKNHRNDEIQPSTTITTSESFLQTTPISSDQGLRGLTRIRQSLSLEHTFKGIQRRRFTADRFWQNLQKFLRGQNDGASVISDQTVRIAEPSDGQDKRSIPEDCHDQMTPIATSDRPPPSDSDGSVGRREDPESLPVRESSNMKKEERLMHPLQEITKSNSPKRMADLKREKLQLEEACLKLEMEQQRLKLELEEERKNRPIIIPMAESTPSTDQRRRLPFDPSFQRTPIFSGGGLEIFNRPGGGLEVFTIPGDRGAGVWIVPFDCPCHQLQRNQNDGAPVGSDQTVRKAEPTEDPNLDQKQLRTEE